jgi:hypothetical protein
VFAIGGSLAAGRLCLTAGLTDGRPFMVPVNLLLNVPVSLRLAATGFLLMRFGRPPVTRFTRVGCAGRGRADRLVA